MKIAVIGTGGVGGFFGAKLYRAGYDVRFLARGRHLTAAREKGLRLHTSEGEFELPGSAMAESAAEIGPADLVLFCVKSYDTETAAAKLSPLLRSDTTIISLQNGIDNEEKIIRVTKTGDVFGGVAYIYSTISAPGEITEGGGPKKIVFGRRSGASRSIS